MPQDAIFVGIDVSKARLDVYVHPSGESFSVANDRAGIKQLGARMRALQPRGVALEASGGYERAVAKGLFAKSLPIYIVDPSQVRSFAKALRRRAKTDPLDAMMIARCLAVTIDVLRPYVPDPAADRLSALVGYRSHLVAEKTALLSYQDTTEDSVVRSFVARQITGLALRIATLDKAIAVCIAEHPNFASNAKIIRTAPGVGPVLSATLLADLPELGQLDRRRVASLVGVAPHARQTGRTDRGGKCSGGRRQVRTVLYMAVLSAIKARSPVLRPFYDRLRQSGMEFKPAIVAVMRKLITILNAMVRDRKPFQQATA
ncbi:MAG: IS110 family transposase [Xanthobacteraceae bacterium]|jgi:transposase